MGRRPNPVRIPQREEERARSRQPEREVGRSAGGAGDAGPDAGVVPEGKCSRQIAAILTAENRPTKRGGRWQSATVTRILARHCDAAKATAA
ncbi:recombinase family protein [Mycobacterium sp. ITM-2016-00316]|nr:recombinase family protein [Mycobacterium sp. ITM-2016-00316]WNG84953.1 recombinase family protein [Mycobacterium sp. ITM-2016-00316]